METPETPVKPAEEYGPAPAVPTETTSKVRNFRCVSPQCRVDTFKGSFAWLSLYTCPVCFTLGAAL